jgi:pimeloyl-ACP methyl ester carboxylesterase
MRQQTFHFSPNVAINYRVQGHGPTVLVFLHGFAAALTTWDDLAPLFPAERFTLYLLDLKGFGFSSKPRDRRYRPEDQAAVVAAFLEAQRLRDVVLVGHSLGGGIALLACLRTATERIGRLILIDCTAYPQRLPRLFHILRTPLLNRLLLRVVPLRTIVRHTLSHVYHDPASMTPERIERYATCFGRKGIASVFIATVRELHPRAYADIIARYPTIAVPTLIIWGEEDRIIAPRLGERLAGAIPGARLVTVPACGHNPHEERASETFAAIAAFLDGREVQRARRP